MNFGISIQHTQALLNYTPDSCPWTTLCSNLNLNKERRTVSMWSIPHSRSPKGARWLLLPSSSVQRSKMDQREEKKDERGEDGREMKRKGRRRMRKERMERGREGGREAGKQAG